MAKLFLLVLLIVAQMAIAQNAVIKPDLNKIDTLKNCVVLGREISVNEAVHFNAEPNDGLLWFRNIDFANGTIEADLKGKNEQGKSFVGIAFHGLNDSVYDVVYFRAFNFKNPERSNHSVQYISHPEYPWYVLRKEFPEKYENYVNPVPEPEDWFHVTVEINYPKVRVYVNNAKEPSLEVEQLNDREHGWVGFWAGYGSEGSYKNLIIKPK